MAKRVKYDVCGVPVTVTERTTGGGNIYPGATFRHGSIGAVAARKLLNTVFPERRVRLPRPGYETILCRDWVLRRYAGKLELHKRSR